MVTRVIQYFCFPDKTMKVETSWISRKGGILEKGGGMIPLTNYGEIWPVLIVGIYYF